jgi:uncharacterized protein (DUF433 family)
MISVFTPELVSRVVRLSQWQLQYWAALDIVRPSIAEAEAAAPALYSFQDLIKLKVAARLRRKLRPSQIGQLLRQLERRGYGDPFLTVRFGETRDGRQLVYLDPTDRLPLSAHGREVGTIVETFGLPIEEIRTDLERQVQRATRRRHGEIAKVRSIQGSAPVVKGTRVPVEKLAALAHAGWSDARIREAFPHLTERDIAAALKYEREHQARSA